MKIQIGSLKIINLYIFKFLEFRPTLGTTYLTSVIYKMKKFNIVFLIRTRKAPILVWMCYTDTSDDLPNTRLRAYPTGAWHHNSPDLIMTSAVPLMYAPPTHVAVETRKRHTIYHYRGFQTDHVCKINCLQSHAGSVMDFYVYRYIHYVCPSNVYIFVLLSLHVETCGLVWVLFRHSLTTIQISII